MEGPFHFGSPLPPARFGDLFHGFEEERRTLHSLLIKRPPPRIGLLGDPRSGKTSLLLSLKEPPNRVLLDCSRIFPATASQAYSMLAQAMGQSLTGAPWVGPPEAVYPSLPVPRRGTEGLLVLENAEALLDIDAGLLEELALLTVRLPYPVVLTGRPAPLRPYVEASVELRGFTEASATDFLSRRFRSAGLDVDDDALAVAYEFTRGRPESLQRIGRAAWEMVRQRSKTRVTAEFVELAVAELLDRLPSASLAPWSALRGIMRDVFVAMCLYNLSSPTEIAQRIGHEPKNVIVLLGRLESVHGLVERIGRGVYLVKDPLLKHYVRKEWSSPIVR